MMRISEAGLALITRIGSAGETQYLTQWSKTWQAFSLIGGHREGTESFRECCIREVAEELCLISNIDFEVASEPVNGSCEYTALSHSAGVLTHYRFELFITDILSSKVMEKVNAIPENRWLDESEIRQRRIPDNRPVANQVATVLELCGILSLESKTQL